ncbi:hypothetical protein ACIPTP_21915 [Pectobacterium versatile]|uniref:hypothetical protein n=1 Tax=Pectobacterium versatile TaxID=2488639 RepID=UPI003813396A
MSNSTGKSLLAWMLVPLVVYGSLMAYWAIKIIAEEWPNETGKLLMYALGCIALLLMLAYKTKNCDFNDGILCSALVVLSGLGAIVCVLVSSYLNIGVLSLPNGCESILVTTFFPVFFVIMNI